MLFLFSHSLCQIPLESSNTSTQDSLSQLDSKRFDAELHGIPRDEARRAIESGLSPVRILELLSMGIRPNEYLSAPWRRLGITEKEWLNGRAMGTTDAERDPSLQRGIPQAAYENLLAPGLGSWKSGHPYSGWLAGAALATWSIALTQSFNHEPRAPFWIAGALGIHLWSFRLGFKRDSRMPDRRIPPLSPPPSSEECYF